jgi:membrane-bound serine protease (ClpP class)
MPEELLGALLYVLGLGLLFLELFIVSFGLLALSGLICTGFGIYLLLTSPAWPGGIVAILLTGLYAYGLFRFWSKRVTISASLAGSDVTTEESMPADIVGQEGVTVTILRPAGFASIGDRRLPVVTDGSFVPKGGRVRVIDVSGNRIMVTRVDEPADEAEDEDAL